MTTKTPAEIEIEKLEKEIERLKLIVKEKFNENKITQTISEFNERQSYRIEIAEKEAKLSGLKQGIELGRKEMKITDIEYLALEEENKKLQQQLSNKEKEIIEKIKKLQKSRFEYQSLSVFQFMEELIKQIEGEK